jgi:hypothetical protein
MLLEATPTPPMPDTYFWYATSAILAAIVVFFIVRIINSVDSWMKESGKRFELVLNEIKDLRQTQAVQAKVIETQGKAIEDTSREVSANIKLANEMAQMLQFLNGAREKDEDNPTVRRFRGK